MQKRNPTPKIPLAPKARSALDPESNRNPIRPSHDLTPLGNQTPTALKGAPLPLRVPTCDFGPPPKQLNLDSAVERVLFLTQRRKGAEKRVFLCFLRVIFIFATPYKRHPIGGDSLCQKNSFIFHFPAELHFFLCSTLHLCDSALKSTAVFRLNLLNPLTPLIPLTKSSGDRPHSPLDRPLKFSHGNLQLLALLSAFVRHAGSAETWQNVENQCSGGKP